MNYKDHIFNHSNDSIIICNNDGVIVEANPASARSFDTSVEDLIGKNMINLYGNESDALHVKNALIKHQEFNGEVLNKTISGNEFWSHLSASRIYNDTGEYIGTMGISRDITNQKKTKENYKAIINKATDFIYTTNEQGQFTFLNEGLTNMTGYETEKCLGSTFIDFIHPKWQVKIATHYQEMFVKKELNSYLEFEMICSSGESLWIGQNVTTNFSENDPEKILGYFGIVRDISKRKKVEEKLNESEIRYRELFENSSDLIQEIDSNGNFKFVNSSWLSTLEYSLEEVQNLNLFELIHPDSGIHCQNLFQGILSSGKCIEERPNYYMVTKSGKKIYVEGAIFVRQNDDETLTIQSFLRDLTDEKKLRELATYQSNEIKQSINYAKNIQISTLPTHEELTELLSESFILLEAKDSLSGDFYVVDRIKSNSSENLTAILVADCTGHGVPGGILSLLCNALLKETFGHPEINNPAEGLEYVRIKLGELFRYSADREVHDGMDAVFCVLNRETNQMYFSGANLNCYIIRNKEVITIKGDRQHVGHSERSVPFTNQIIELVPGDAIYMFTDGYVDQFGGPDGRKFMKGRLLKLLIEIHENEMSEQYETISTTFQEWKGDLEQTDDVTLLGFRY